MSIPRLLFSFLVGAAVLSSCQTYQDEASFYEVPPPALPPPPPRIVRYPHVARNGVSTLSESPPPSCYDDFRRRRDYRLTFQTWVNHELLKSGGKKRVVIDLANQRGQCFVDEQIAMDFPVCTGTPTHLTPTGSFHISEKDVHHRSNLYHCAMPYFMRLTNEGIGLHVGDVYRMPASHGCIRITRDACIALFNALPHGTEVTITP